VIFQRTVLSGLVAELPPEVWSSDEVERRLAPLYGRLKLPEGRLELMTGIKERRFWPQAIRPSAASALAGRRAMQAAGVGPADIDLLIHSSVCRDRLEPSTAAYVHGLLGLGPQAQILDVSNACLGFLNAVALAAGMVESGQIRRALVCSGEDTISPLLVRSGSSAAPPRPILPPTGSARATRPSPNSTCAPIPKRCSPPVSRWPSVAGAASKASRAGTNPRRIAW